MIFIRLDMERIAAKTNFGSNESNAQWSIEQRVWCFEKGIITRFVRLITFKGSDSIASVAKVPREEEEEEGTEGEENGSESPAGEGGIAEAEDTDSAAETPEPDQE